MTRTELLQSIINKFDYKDYLEIGCDYNYNFDQIVIQNKIGVDPVRGGTHRMTSDDFFESNIDEFDIIFIDGLHLNEQVDKDIINSVSCLRKNGTIVMHDCNPMVEDIQYRHMISTEWTGDVWKSFVKHRGYGYLDMAVGDFDYGCGVIRVRKNSDLLSTQESLEWENLVINRQNWLRLMSFEELMNWV